MSSWPERCGLRRAVFALVGLVACAAAAAPAAPPASAYPGIGRTATPAEVAAWDIDVRPDFQGLPAGAGSAVLGMQVWESRCASCHGIFGESNEFFSPLVGGTTKQDIERGRTARLDDAAYPGRTTLMKLSTLSTLWDYIRRAMPWQQPKSLTTEEVYAVTAYLLHLGGIVPNDFVLSDRNIAEVQRRLPNRDGKTLDHAMWPGRGFGHRRPDVRAEACQRDCGPAAVVASFLPDHARDAHGNLAEQNRLVGAQRGAETTRAASRGAAVAAVAAAPPASRPAEAATAGAAALASARQHGCTACHAVDAKLLGPSFREIAQRHGARADAAPYLAGKIVAGSAGVWGAIPMPAQTIADEPARALARWLADGARL